MWSCVTHCAVLDWSYCEFRKTVIQDLGRPTVFTMKLPLMVFILYSPISCMKTKVSCPMWLVTLRNKRSFFSFFSFFWVCHLSLSSSLPFSLFFLHKKQIMRNCGFLCPCCLSLWVCHSTRKKSESGCLWILSDLALIFAWVLKKTKKHCIPSEMKSLCVVGCGGLTRHTPFPASSLT